MYINCCLIKIINISKKKRCIIPRKKKYKLQIYSQVCQIVGGVAIFFRKSKAFLYLHSLSLNYWEQSSHRAVLYIYKYLLYFPKRWRHVHLKKKCFLSISVYKKIPLFSPLLPSPEISSLIFGPRCIRLKHIVLPKH